MKKTYLCINTTRTCYALSQMGRTLTIGELIERLQEYDLSMPVAFKNDNGYTYGEIYGENLEEQDEDED